MSEYFGWLLRLGEGDPEAARLAKRRAEQEAQLQHQEKLLESMFRVTDSGALIPDDYADPDIEY